MNGRFLMYAVFVTALSTFASWGKMFSTVGNSNGYNPGGSSWSNTVGGGGGSYGGGAGGSGHK